MRSRLRERPSRRPVAGCPRSLQPVSRMVGQRPLEFIRHKAWTADPLRFSNGISAVSTMCLVDQPGAGGAPVLITGDDDGGLAVQRLPAVSEEGRGDTSQRSPALKLRRAQIHFTSINTIKVLADQRGFVCAGDDSVISAVASLEVSSEEDIRRAAFPLMGHSGFVTDCDTADSGHGILSSGADGKMLLWDPMASNTPVARVNVGRPLTSACFSAGDPYALICAPELGMDNDRDSDGMGGGGFAKSGRNNGGKEDDIVQIWDLRSLRCFRDSIPAAVAAAFGEVPTAPAPMQPPRPRQRTSIWADHSSHFGVSSDLEANTPRQTPAWLTSMLGSTTTASPATPLLRRSAWADESSSDTDSTPSGSRWHRGTGSLWPCRTPDGHGSEHAQDSEHGAPDSISPAGKNSASSRTTYLGSETASTRMSSSSSSDRRTSGSSSSGGGGGGSSTPFYSPAPKSVSKGKGDWVSGLPMLARVATSVRDGPKVSVAMASLPEGCLHEGGGKTWLPGGLMTWQPSKRRAHTANARCYNQRVDIKPAQGSSSVTSEGGFVPRRFPDCQACRSGFLRADNQMGASVYHLQASSDGRAILMASRDATVALWDTQSREVVYRFGHSELSMRARPILVEGAEGGSGGGGGGGGDRGDVFAGTRDGEIKAWKVGSRFPHRVYKPYKRHLGFEITCVATSRDGSMFASADSSGAVHIQSATAGRGAVHGEEGEGLD